MLGNILDNAITAASKLDNGYINLAIKQADTYLAIHCENNHHEKSKKEKVALSQANLLLALRLILCTD